MNETATIRRPTTEARPRNDGLEVRSIKIDPSVIDPKDVGMLQDLIAAAFNQAVQKAQALTAEAMQSAMGPLAGMNIPGLF